VNNIASAPSTVIGNQNFFHPLFAFSSRSNQATRVRKPHRHCRLWPTQRILYLLFCNAGGFAHFTERTPLPVAYSAALLMSAAVLPLFAKQPLDGGNGVVDVAVHVDETVFPAVHKTVALFAPDVDRFRWCARTRNRVRAIAPSAPTRNAAAASAGVRFKTGAGCTHCGNRRRSPIHAVHCQLLLHQSPIAVQCCRKRVLCEISAVRTSPFRFKAFAINRGRLVSLRMHKLLLQTTQSVTATANDKKPCKQFCAAHGPWSRCLRPSMPRLFPGRLLWAALPAIT